MAKKQFDEWWLLEAQNIVGVGRATEKDVAETAWEAALEWAEDVDWGHAECDALGDCLMRIKIDEELGNE